MVLGLRTKSRRGPSVHVDYLVHVQEIRPWPPSNSLKSLRSVLLQWENGDRNSGSTNPVVPSLGSGVGDGKIEFNESFKVPVTLSRELSIKGGDTDTFLRNCLEFNLYELRSNKVVKGQLLGTVTVDFAEYGILKETLNLNAPVNCKRSFRNTTQPVLFMKIEPFHKRNSRSSSMENLSKQASLNKDGRESISALMDEEDDEDDEEAEIASFTDDDDDDGSQHSSLTVSSSAFEATGASPPQNEENAFEAVHDTTGGAKNIPDLPLEVEDSKPVLNPVSATQEHVIRSSSHSSSVDSSEIVDPENVQAPLSNLTGNNLRSHIRTSVQSSFSSITYEEDEGEEEEAMCNNSTQNFEPKSMPQEVHEKSTSGKENAQLHTEENKTSDLYKKLLSSHTDPLVGDKRFSVTSGEFKEVDTKQAWGPSRAEVNEASNMNGSHVGHEEERDGKKELENGQTQQTEDEKDHAMEFEASYNHVQNPVRKLGDGEGDATSTKRDPEMKSSTPTSTKLKHVKSVRSLLDTARSKRFESHNQFIAESNISEDTDSSDNSMAFPMEAKNHILDSRVQQLEHRIESLERELRESAALEVAIYSVVAEHGSSANKVHAPARRLSRLYFHACKWSKPRGASAARSAVSGLVLVAKACGNDVPRLTFWLSNSVVLRAIISLTVSESLLPVSAGPHFETNDVDKGNDKASSQLKWEELSRKKSQNKFGFSEYVDDWEEPRTFTIALEKIEAWIFSRIIESVWWQTLTPHMQSTSKASKEKMNSSSSNSYGRRPSKSDQEQANFSMELWKKAFKDACERLCPVRAAGHECGCLPVLARMVMEQCVNRLDVAMFNAILRESDDDIPTDPVSDPISDLEVLPIPAGNSSFGAGAQLKNAIGNWSRWLTDLFGIDDDDSHDLEDDLNEDDIEECETSSKSFLLLNALSDLLMLPKDMLLSRSIRKEVCPTLGAPLIKRILIDFSPDEFCPDPIPEDVFQALDAEDAFEEEESIKNFPCNAAPIIYSPPSAALFANVIGDAGKESQLRSSGSSVLRKSYTSDDELDELDSPLTSIADSFRSPSNISWKAKEKGCPNVVRYELLQEVWRDGD